MSAALRSAAAPAPAVFRQARNFTSTRGSFAKSGIWEHLTVDNARRYYPHILATCGGVVVIYGLSRLAISSMSLVLGMDLYHAFYIGLGSGLSVALVLGGSAVYVYRMVTINPEVAYKRALARVQGSTFIRAYLGNTIKPGVLKAHNYMPGHLASGKSVGKLTWVEPRVQMLFQVTGEKGEAMVTAEAVKHNGGLVFNLLAIDSPAKGDKPAEILLLQGEQSRLEVQGALRGFLQLPQSSFALIPQNRKQSDEDLVHEQEALPTEEEQKAEEEGELTEEEAIRRKEADARPGRSS